ncbi:cold-shock protein [Paenibacillus sp. GD4]|jgi:hypothetical protein|uniref:cold-shock protein n=1 Tax=Paenibacillus TaxID=44249 RepID=UPI002543BAE8|nr:MULTISPECIES: cold-shock protein [Paenibacillus]MDQ1909339.1 cold-shock protein [Paenibacillus sp. GD4]
MYLNFRNKHIEELPKEDTAVWSCTKEDCKGWMRDNFAFAREPICGICASPMTSEMKMLPLLINSNNDLKAIKRGVEITKTGLSTSPVL